ncbi:Uncharacterised protein [Vibrio cholerae]|nr:Uncharacterised protein [Vibrio cholerae]
MAGLDGSISALGNTTGKPYLGTSCDKPDTGLLHLTCRCLYYQQLGYSMPHESELQLFLHLYLDARYHEARLMQRLCLGFRLNHRSPNDALSTHQTALHSDF